MRGSLRRQRIRAQASIESLEERVVLSATPLHPSYWAISGHPHRYLYHDQGPVTFDPRHMPSDRAVSILDNDGKVISGTDREGDRYTITVHGPGSIIVTDTTPNDGVLDDDIDTIQLVDTDINKTYITATVSSSAKQRTDGQIYFNRLIGESGARSIILNGFSLARTRTPGVQLLQDPEIFLPGGVGELSFENIFADIDLAQPTGYALNTKPFQIVIGDPTTPMTVKPTIRIASIFNTVYDSAYNAARVEGTQVPDPQPNTLPPFPGPQTNPTVEFIVNGELHGLEFLSATMSPQDNGSDYNQFTTVGNTGRTAVRANGIQNLNVRGSAKNFTASRGRQPFADGFSGMNYLGNARFGGTADGLGLDVNGPIRSLQFSKGLGSPIDNRLNSPISTQRNGANLGRPGYLRGYPTATDPSNPNTGGYGGLITATDIGHITAGSAETIGIRPNDRLAQQKYSTNRQAYLARPGNAFTSTAIAAQGSIGGMRVIGDLSNSEVDAGFDYQSFVNGLDPERAPSTVGPVDVAGSTIDSVVTATYGPGPDKIFGTSDDRVGPGAITGKIQGRSYIDGNQATSTPTILGRQGSGFFAAQKSRKLPPPDLRPVRLHGVLVR